jgi:hypothetical protein
LCYFKKKTEFYFGATKYIVLQTFFSSYSLVGFLSTTTIIVIIKMLKLFKKDRKDSKGFIDKESAYKEYDDQQLFSSLNGKSIRVCSASQIY